MKICKKTQDTEWLDGKTEGDIPSRECEQSFRGKNKEYLVLV